MIDLQSLKDRINIVDVAEELGLDPKRSGASFFARCPSHDDQGRPNMAIDQKKGAICFRCGYKADVIRLVADVRYHGDQGEAIRYLANKAGMTDSKPSSRRKEPLPKGASLPKEEPAKTPTVESSWNSLTVTFPAGAKMVAVKTGELPALIAAYVAELPDAEKFSAEMLLSGATVFERAHPFTARFGVAMNWSAEHLDDFWRFCGAL